MKKNLDLPWLLFFTGVYIFFTSQFLALRGLISAGKKVEELLQKGLIESARKELKALVGRDTEFLSEEEIRIAIIESLAENLNDAVIAPLFYLGIGGLLGIVLYKTVNTLDSMVGYKNEKYIKLGWFSAKMDDFFNYVPARIAGILIVFSAFLIKGKTSGKRALKIMLRDGRKHPSPNSGIPESAMAGALGIKVGGPCRYQGILSIKPYIGDNLFPVSSTLVKTAIFIVIISSFSFLLILVLCKFMLKN